MYRKSATIASPPRSLREAIAQSQLETGEILARVGCSRRSLTLWKAGQRPSDYYIARLSKTLGVDLWLFYGQPSNDKVLVQSQESSGDPRLKALVNADQCEGSDVSRADLGHRGRLDESMRAYWSDQLDGLWAQFHFSTGNASIHLQRIAVSTHRNLLQTLATWPMNDEERNWLLIQMCEGNILAGRIARDQLNFEEAVHLHKSALKLAMRANSTNHVAGAFMRLAETLFDGGSVVEAEQYAISGIEQARGHANARVFGELLGLTGSIHATLGDHVTSEKLVNEAAALSIGSASQATACGIRFGETAASTYQMVEALRRGDARAALGYIKAAVERIGIDFPQGGNVRWEAHLFIHEARTLAAMGELDEACASLRCAVQLASQVNSRIGARKVQDVLVDIGSGRRGQTAMLQSLQQELKHTLSLAGTLS